MALFRRCLATSILNVLALAAMSQAHAAVILAGNSNASSFSGCGSGCSSSVTLASSVNGGSDSVLSIIDTSFSVSDNTTGLVLAELQLVAGNKAGAGEDPLNFYYNLVINFTTPTALENDMLTLGLSGTGTSGSNGEIDITGLSLALAPLHIANIDLSNFHFIDVLNKGSGTTFSNGEWTVNGQSTATLELVADVTDPVSIPEPSSLALFGSALVCAGVLGQKRWRRTGLDRAS